MRELKMTRSWSLPQLIASLGTERPSEAVPTRCEVDAVVEQMLHREKEREEHEEHEEQVSQPCTARDHNDRLSDLLSSVVSSRGRGDFAGLSKKELKTLLATAKDAADHQRLRVLPGQAPTPTEKRQEFSAQADYLAKHLGLGRPASIELKQGISLQLHKSLSYLSKLYASGGQGFRAVGGSARATCFISASGL